MTPVSPSLQIIPQSSFKAVPWKNGAGVTREVIRVPAHSEDFVWRVSVAQVDASGPFSDFAAYNRTMVLLKGTGLELRFANGQRQVLGRIGEWLQFDGAVATHCHLLGGPCVDLNLMVAKARTVTARVESLQASMEIPASEGPTLIFGIDAALRLDMGGEEPRYLQPWDLAVVTNGVVRVQRKIAASPAPAAVFIATIHH